MEQCGQSQPSIALLALSWVNVVRTECGHRNNFILAMLEMSKVDCSNVCAQHGKQL